MKNNKLLFLILLFLTITSSSCNDDDDKEPPPPPPISNCENLEKDADEKGIDCGGATCEPCHDVIVDNEILIRHLSIVNSEAATTGDLSFGKLVERLSPNDTKEVLKSLVESWQTEQVSNDKVITPRPAVTKKIIELWKANQGVTNQVDFEMNLKDAPFRLLAITNRVDLQNEQQSGEGRLTFGLTHNGINDFTLIFEYKLVGASKEAHIKWAKRWHQLSNLNKESEAYKDTLVAIVKAFSADGSMLNQVRTNEVLGGFEDRTFKWEFREFNLIDGRFAEVSRKDSPDTDLNNTILLENYVKAHQEDILAGKIVEEFEGNKILAGNTLYSSNFKWKIPSGDTILNEALEVLDFKSCVGCHGGFASDTRFTHIKPRSKNGIAEISSFLEEDAVNRRKNSINILQLDTTLAFLNRQNFKSVTSTMDTFSTTKILKSRSVNDEKSIQKREATIKLLKKMEGIPRVH